MSPPVIDKLRRGAAGCGVVERAAIVALMLVLISFSLLQIVLRNFFATGVVWADDFLRHGVMWLSFLGAMRATAEEGHIVIDLVPRLLQPRYRRWLKAICCLLATLVCSVLVAASLRFIRDERLSGNIAFGIIPSWWLELIFPLSFAVMSLRFFFGSLHHFFAREIGP